MRQASATPHSTVDIQHSSSSSHPNETRHHGTVRVVYCIVHRQEARQISRRRVRFSTGWSLSWSFGRWLFSQQHSVSSSTTHSQQYSHTTTHQTQTEKTDIAPRIVGGGGGANSRWLCVERPVVHSLVYLSRSPCALLNSCCSLRAISFVHFHVSNSTCHSQCVWYLITILWYLYGDSPSRVLHVSPLSPPRHIGVRNCGMCGTLTVSVGESNSNDNSD